MLQESAYLCALVQQLVEDWPPNIIEYDQSM